MCSAVHNKPFVGATLAVARLQAKIQKGVVMVDWGTAVQVFIFGFGGVFISLALLTIAIQLSGKIIHTFVSKKK